MEDITMVSQEIEREAHVSIGMENIHIASQDTKIEDVALIEIDGLQHDPVVTSTRGMLESLSPLSSDCCIYKVSKKLRKLNVEAYTPQVVSIGPFHLGKKHLQDMEEHKLRYLQTFLNRTGQSLEHCVEVVRKWEKRARDCYAETIGLSSDEFVKMILVDGSFIVELLLRSNFRQLIDKSDRIFHKPEMINDLLRDLILLENQLPFIVLEEFFKLIPVSNLKGNPSFLELTHERFKCFLPTDKLPDTISSPGILKHFVDFILRCHLSSLTPLSYKGNVRYGRPPSATELHDAGIKFMKRSSSSLLDIKFTNRILEIPHLEIDDSSETLFRNLIAFEQCHYAHKHFTDYMYLLDGIINNPKDVDLLIHDEIIENSLGSSEDVSELFNNIVKEVYGGEQFYFSCLRNDLKEYCKTPWPKWKAALKRDYFNTPWKAVSFIAAVVLLVLTFVQTMYSVKFL